MLLELCTAYTSAINGGSLPCIESAWTYLCQNECQRAMTESIDFYESQLSLQVLAKWDKDFCVPYD